MTLSGKKIGVAITGSYCTYDQVFPQIERLVQENAEVYTIFSDRSQITDTRFGKANDFMKKQKLSQEKNRSQPSWKQKKLVPITCLML
jgi:dipicolinate synthase subunit B